MSHEIISAGSAEMRRSAPGNRLRTRNIRYCVFRPEAARLSCCFRQLYALDLDDLHHELAATTDWLPGLCGRHSHSRVPAGDRMGTSLHRR
jgi:hypothetical protein